jgi:uncharacterized protein YhhL (DUF1145 family)
MNVEMIRTAKTALNVFWGVTALSFLVPGSGALLTTLRAVFLITLAAHALEYVIFGRTLPRSSGTPGHHFVQVMLYGFFHIQPAKAAGVPAAPAD